MFLPLIILHIEEISTLYIWQYLYSFYEGTFSLFAQPQHI